MSVYFYYAARSQTLSDQGRDNDNDRGRGGDGYFLDEGSAWAFCVGVSGLWTVVFGVFLALMKKEYRKSFFSSLAGKENSMNLFLKGVGDEDKSEIMNTNEHQWQTIRKTVERWVRNNWERWERDRPDWFTEDWKERVPIEFVPKGRGRGGRGGRRRSSAARLFGLGEAGTESVRVGAGGGTNYLVEGGAGGGGGGGLPGMLGMRRNGAAYEEE